MTARKIPDGRERGHPWAALPLLALLFALLPLPACVVRTPTGEVDQEATRQVNQNIADTFKVILETGAAAARARMEYEAEKKRLEAEKEKRKACPVCHGTGAVACPDCGGRGWFPCSFCRGRGRTPFGPCPHCRGTGKVGCRRCGGKGLVPCPRCGR